MACGGRKSCDWLLQTGAGDLQKEGVQLMLDCKWEEAKIVFEGGRGLNPSLAGAHCMVLLMRYLSTFEEQHKTPIMEAIKWAEEACGSPNGIFKKELEAFEASKPEEDLMLKAAELHLEISLGDCEICHAISAMLSMDLSGFVKGGWHLRKAWKLYETSYRQAKLLYDENETNFLDSAPCTCFTSVPFGACETDILPRKNVHPTTANRGRSRTARENPRSPTVNEARPRASTALDNSVNEQKSCLRHSSQGQIKTEDLIRSEMVHQLLSSAAFGYGLFHLCISILAPQVLRVVQFLGFPSNRETGLSCLKFVSRSRHPLKSSVAALCLLWYHTIARPFFALDLSSVSAGVGEAEKILRRQPKSKDTVLFLFFRGRCERLKKDLSGSLSTFTKALDAAGDQRELRMMCIYEIGWCHLVQMHWNEARQCFAEMKAHSKWAPAYYAYVEGLCVWAERGNAMAEAQTLFINAVALVKKKKNPVEAFVLKRAKQFSKEERFEEELAILYVLEMVYLWRALQNTPEFLVKKMLERIESFEMCDSNSIHLSLQCLVEGALLAELDRRNFAEIRFKNAINLWETGQKSKDTKHIPAFAAYELGCLLIGQKDTVSQGKLQLEKAKNQYKGYDFENRLQVRIHAALESLK